MRKIVSIFAILVMLFTVNVSAFNAEQEQQKAEREVNEIMSNIESQTLDQEGNMRFIYVLFALVGVSMIFEYFVRKYKDTIRKLKDENKQYKDIRKKLWLTYLIHIILTVIFAFVIKVFNIFTDMYVFFLVMATVYIVEIGPLFTFRFKLGKKGENK